MNLLVSFCSSSSFIVVGSSSASSNSFGICVLFIFVVFCLFWWHVYYILDK